jgi:hypothetical protein
MTPPELEAARSLAASTSPGQFAAIAEEFAVLYNRGDREEVWRRRCAFGYSASESMMSQPAWFWFNAYAALSGLILRELPGGYLEGFCGAADVAVDWDDPEQVAAVRQINAIYFGE